MIIIFLDVLYLKVRRADHKLFSSPAASATYGAQRVDSIQMLYVESTESMTLKANWESADGF